MKCTPSFDWFDMYVYDRLEFAAWVVPKKIQFLMKYFQCAIFAKKVCIRNFLKVLVKSFSIIYFVSSATFMENQ